MAHSTSIMLAAPEKLGAVLKLLKEWLGAESAHFDGITYEVRLPSGRLVDVEYAEEYLGYRYAIDVYGSSEKDAHEAAREIFYELSQLSHWRLGMDFDSSDEPAVSHPPA